MTVTEYIALPRDDARFGTRCSDSAGAEHGGARYIEVWVQKNGTRRRTPLCAACARLGAAKRAMALPEASA